MEVRGNTIFIAAHTLAGQKARAVLAAQDKDIIKLLIPAREALPGLIVLAMAAREALVVLGRRLEGATEQITKEAVACTIQVARRGAIPHQQVPTAGVAEQQVKLPITPQA